MHMFLMHQHCYKGPSLYNNVVLRVYKKCQYINEWLYCKWINIIFICLSYFEQKITFNTELADMVQVLLETICVYQIKVCVSQSTIDQYSVKLFFK